MLGRPTDIELVELCRKGDAQAWEEIIRRYSESMKWMAYSLCNNEVEAEDLVQDVFIIIYKHIPGMECKRENSLKAFIEKVVFNTFITSYRKSRAKKRGGGKSAVPLDQADDDGVTRNVAVDDNSPEDELIKNKEAEMVRKALLKIRQPCRKVLYLRYFEGLDYKNMSKILDRKVCDLHRIVHRCLKELRGLYVSMHGE